MRRILLFGLTLALMAGAGIAYSATSGGGLPGGVAVWGGGHAAPLGDRDFSVVATQAGGRFLYGVHGLASPIVGGDVTCVNVSGNHAVVGGIVREAYFAPQAIGKPFLWYAVDNGDPSSTTPDQITAAQIGFTESELSALPEGFPAVCPSALTLFGGVSYVNLTTGDLVVQATGVTSSATTNLIVNGDAEAGAGSDGNGTLVPVPGWSTTSNFTVVSYALGEPFGYPGPTSPGPTDRGQNFFDGGPDNPVSTASQTIGLVPFTKLIVDGATLRLSGWLGGYDGQDDNAVLSVTFKDASNATIGTTTTIGPVLAADRGGITGLVYREATGVVPKGAKSVVVTLTMTRAPELGNVFNDGYADNLSLVLVPAS